jgi:hypothetical protein
MLVCLFCVFCFFVFVFFFSLEAIVMKKITTILVVSVLAVLSSSSENSFVTQQWNGNPAMRNRAFYYFHPTHLPGTQFYPKIPLVNYYPYFPIAEPNKLMLNEDNQRSDIANSRPTTPPPTLLIDQNLSDEEAMTQLEILKEIYTRNNENGVILPSILPSSRGFIALKTTAFISFLNSFSLAAATKTKTKIFVYPTFG